MLKANKHGRRWSRFFIMHRNLEEKGNEGGEILRFNILEYQIW